MKHPDDEFDLRICLDGQQAIETFFHNKPTKLRMLTTLILNILTPSLISTLIKNRYQNQKYEHLIEI